MGAFLSAALPPAGLGPTPALHSLPGCLLCPTRPYPLRSFGSLDMHCMCTSCWRQETRHGGERAGASATSEGTVSGHALHVYELLATRDTARR